MYAVGRGDAHGLERTGIGGIRRIDGEEVRFALDGRDIAQYRSEHILRLGRNRLEVEADPVPFLAERQSLLQTVGYLQHNGVS